jgi:hypothetical protein
VPCSSFVDISFSDVMLDISFIDVEYFHKTVRMSCRCRPRRLRTSESLSYQHGGHANFKTSELTLLSLYMLLSNYRHDHKMTAVFQTVLQFPPLPIISEVTSTSQCVLFLCSLCYLNISNCLEEIRLLMLTGQVF